MKTIPIVMGSGPQVEARHRQRKSKRQRRRERAARRWGAWLMDVQDSYSDTAR